MIRNATGVATTSSDVPVIARSDEPGSWHHVLNRGLARRPILESPVDARVFLALLARTTRSGLLEVHAFSLLTTHYHLLVRSPSGRLAEGMRDLQRGYVLWFNRTRERDGSLFKGRFRSKRIPDEGYWRTVVRYIDNNPVAAGLAKAATGYPFGSRFHYALRRGPPWLTRGVIEGIVAHDMGSSEYDPRAYDRVFPPALPEEEADLVDRLMLAGRADRGSLVPMDDAGRFWMMRRALLADGVRAMTPTVSPRSVELALHRARRSRPSWRVRPTRKASDGWRVLLAGLLRSMAGLGFLEIGRRMGCGVGTVRRLVRAHAHLLQADEQYRRSAESVVDQLIGGES